MPLVFVIDERPSMYMNCYSELKENFIMTAYHFVKILGTHLQSDYFQFMSIFNKRKQSVINFRKEIKYILDIIKTFSVANLNELSTEMKFVDIMKKCDDVLTKTWGCSTINQIILITNGGSKFLTEPVELGVNFRSMVHVVSLRDFINGEFKSLAVQTGGSYFISPTEWKLNQTGEYVAQSLFETFLKNVPNLDPSIGQITLGHFNMKAKILPFIYLNYYAQSKQQQRSRPNKHIQVNIQGFIALSDWNYPCSTSDHVIIHESDESDEANNLSSVHFAQMLNTALLNTKSAALCTLNYTDEYCASPVVADNSNTTRYAYIRNYIINETKHTLKLCLIPYEYEGLPWLGKFKDMIPISHLPELDSRYLFPIKSDDDCSYKSNNNSDDYQYTTWVCNPSIVVNDFYKIIRISKRLADDHKRRAVFTKEITKFKETALSVGSPILVTSLCRMLDREMQQHSSAPARDIIRAAVESMANIPGVVRVELGDTSTDVPMTSLN